MSWKIGEEPYADPVSRACTLVFMLTVEKDISASSIDGCSLSTTPSSSGGFCTIMSSEYNNTHFFAMITASVPALGSVYHQLDIQLSFGGLASESYTLGTTVGSLLTYFCEETPLSTLLFTKASDPKVLYSSNGVNNMQFTSYLDINTNVFKRPLVGLKPFTNNIQTEISPISLSKVFVKVTFSDSSSTPFTSQINIGLTLSNSISIPNPFFDLDYPSVTFQEFSPTQFEIPPFYGYHIKVLSDSVHNVIPPVNFLLIPLEGQDIHNMTYYFKNQQTSFQPKVLTNNAISTFWNVLPQSPPSSLYLDSLQQMELFTFKFNTPAKFSLSQSQNVGDTFYPSYPFGLVSYGTNTRNYDLSFAIRAEQKILDLFISAPGGNVFRFNANAPLDTVPPQFSSFNVLVLNHTHSVLRVGATDDMSGVNYIYIKTFLRDIYLNRNNLVSGSETDGIYEIIVPFKKSFLVNQAYILDITGNKREVTPLSLSLNYGLAYQPFGSALKLDSFSFNKLVVDVSNGPVDVIAYANITQTFAEREQQNSIVLNLFFNPLLDNPVVLGTYNDSLQLYQFPFTVQAKLIPGAVQYSVTLNQGYQFLSDYLFGIFDTVAQLMIKNTNDVDMMFPLVTKVQPSSFVPAPLLNTSGTPILLVTLSWDFEFYDPNGVKKVVIGISSERDVQGRNFTHDCQGKTLCQKTIDYQLDSNYCVKMNYYVQYVYTEDMLGNKGETVRYSNIGIHPFLKFDKSTIDFQEPTCPPAREENPPTIKDVQITGSSPTNSYDNVDVVFTIQDDDAGVSLAHTPVCYFHAYENKFIESVANVTKINSEKSVTYTCYFIISEFSPVFYLSIYGISDNLFNFIGFSTNNLAVSGFLYSYSLKTQRDYFIYIESTSSLEISTDELYLYGNFIFSSFPKVEIQTDIEKLTLTPNIATGRVLLLHNIDIKPSLQYNITVTNNGQKSNTVTVKGKLPPVTNTPIITPPVTISPTQTPTATCSSDCGSSLGYGACSRGTCVCNPPRSGLDCKSLITSPIITPNVDTPSVNLTLPSDGGQSESKSPTFTSFIAVVSIGEFNLNNELVSNHLFNYDKWQHIKEGSSKTDQFETIQYKYTINNELNTTITSTMYVFSQACNITFGNQELFMNPNTIKFTFNITQYPFALSTNTLQLVMTATLESSQSVSCSYKEFIDDSSNSQYLQIQIQDRSLFGRFIKFGMIDGRESTISNTQLDDNYGGSSLSKSKSDQSFIGLNIPYYTKYALLDPDFSVLIDSVSANDRENSICTFESKKKLTTAQIYVKVGPKIEKTRSEINAKED
ncbi:hypothetical protein CYY_000415 [Polysphondylium violaceum]|uniref:EGF-like domain-containing protein n=1 Tax=Polysphondylium violaceum TaxID=133409 RepID=A0A8J4Q1P2_9MYCE|nr:hypothetical protein CYY_000415 [Polysphondylium violaceum]